MKNSLITSCPHCNTRFRLLPAQLEAAGGMVRCGVCNEVFDGHQLLEQPQQDNDAELLIDEDLGLDLESKSFEQKLAMQSAREQEMFSFAEPQHNPFTQVQHSEPGYDEEAWAAELLAQEGEQLPEDLQLTLVPQADEDTDNRLSLTPQQILPAVIASPPENTVDDEQQQSDLFDIYDEPLQLSWQPKNKSLGKRIALVLAIIVCLLALVGQYIYFNYQQLARNPAIAQLMQSYCPTLGCPLPKMVDTSLLKSSNLMVRRHPEFDEALLIDAVIYNRASYNQAYPLIRLDFLDQQQQIIASRTFNPGEYLGGELAGSQSMPAQIPIRISFEVLNPSSLTSDYSLEFISPE